MRKLTKFTDYIKGVPPTRTSGALARTHIPIDAPVDLPMEDPIAQIGPGDVIGVDPKTQMATIKGDKIEGWMEAMTMEYPVKDKSEFAKLAAGVAKPALSHSAAARLGCERRSDRGADQTAGAGHWSVAFLAGGQQSPQRR